MQTDAEQQKRDMAQTTTLYVGNLSFHTSEEQLYEVFGHVGEVKRIVMGLDRIRKTPCGFCFVEYGTSSICVLTGVGGIWEDF